MEKYEKLVKLTKSLEYLLCDAIDTINALGYAVSKTSEKPCLYCEYNNLDKCGDCNFIWSDQASAETIMDQIERECEKMADMTIKVKVEPVIHCRECRHAHMTVDGRFCKYCDKFPELEDVYFDKNFYCGSAEIRDRRTKNESPVAL